MKRLTITALIALLCLDCMAAESMEQLTERVFRLAAEQYTAMDRSLREGECPRSLNPDGTILTSDIGWWCSGFYPGSLWYIYEHTGNPEILTLARKHTAGQKALLDMHTDHDIGFMIGCSYGNALRLTGDTALYRGTLLKAAERLAGRFNPVTGTIRSWDGEWTRQWDFPVIIDNMMNLELLMTAFKLTGRKEFKDIASRHAYTTRNNHFRTDYSTFHLVDYSSTDGSVRRKQTRQGFSDGSMWARGEAWALYGFTMMYRKSGDEQFYMQADYIANLLLRSLPEDGIPWWDFSRPGTFKDASAAAIMASAFLQLYEISGRSDFLDMACRQLRTLAGKEYLAKAGTNGNFILKHSVGNFPAGSEIDAPLTYADYYFLEALTIYRRATGHPRLFLNDRELHAIKEQIKDGGNPSLNRLHGQIMADAEAGLDDAPLEWKLDAAGKRILGVAREALVRIVNDSYAYRYSGDRRYLEHAQRTLNEICDMQNWNGWHFLDLAELSAAAGIGYDWLYRELSPGIKEKIVGTLKDKAFDEAYDLSKSWFHEKTHNWNQVCNSGLTIAALALREELGKTGGTTVRNAVRTNSKAMEKIYSPNGCYPEGPSYWSYGNIYQVMLIESMESALGDDFGLSCTAGFSEAGDYALSCIGATHRMFNYYDNSLKESPLVPLWYFAYRFDKPYLVCNEKGFLNDGRYNNRDVSVLPLIMKYISGTGASEALPVNGKVYYGKGPNPIVTARGDGSSSESDWYLGIKGGEADNNHGHADAGSFVFDRDGVRWASDPGSVSYTKVENELKAKGGNFWDRGQNSMRWSVFPIGNEWHNTLTVNGKTHNVKAFADIVRVIDNETEGKGAVIDLTPLFFGELADAVRKIVLAPDKSLEITDELEAADALEIFFTIATECTPEVVSDGIILHNGDKRLKLKAEGADISYSIAKSPEGEASGIKFCRINYTLAAGERVTVKTTLD
mgnify:CR=1 FL=1